MACLRNLLLKLSVLLGVILAPVSALSQPFPSEPAAPEFGATSAIAALHNVLIAISKNADELGFQGRVTQLDPVLKATFDVRLMMRVSMGRFWKDLSPEQQHTLVDAFTRMTIATYANRFDGYSGQRFETLEHQERSRGRVLVKTELVNEDENVSINYLLHRQGTQWTIMDIYLKGNYSELARWRSEYSSVMRTKGYDALIATLEDKIQHLAAD